MKNFTRFALVGAASAALAACGSSDDASSDLEVDTVEIPADEALEPVTEEPVEDPAANLDNVEEPAAVDTQTATEAADAAEDVAAAVEAAEAAEAAAAADAADAAAAADAASSLEVE
ncbi:hypothetical protein [Erythrobacter ani]|uniref:Uncharacterized protein n=1 Tax=Erythrobacter ani TaxID=2827235 RepID=A0ABS6SJZ4_9SPHN|nr:hypothetical protein [Erythrobacter ani]MBV7265354.1 hypothetical protein [Erythrobacter ani]